MTARHRHMGDMADDFTPRYGEVEQMAPGIRRVLARNAGAFTYYGTGTYIIGNGAVAVIDPGPDDADHVHAIRAALEGERVSRSEEHTSELQSLMRISYAVFCLKKKKENKTITNNY